MNSQYFGKDDPGITPDTVVHVCIKAVYVLEDPTEPIISKLNLTACAADLEPFVFVLSNCEEVVSLDIELLDIIESGTPAHDTPDYETQQARLESASHIASKQSVLDKAIEAENWEIVDKEFKLLLASDDDFSHWTDFYVLFHTICDEGKFCYDCFMKSKGVYPAEYVCSETDRSGMPDATQKCGVKEQNPC